MGNENPYAITAAEQSVLGVKNVTAGDDNHNVRSFNKGFNRGKFSQLRYMLGNPDGRVQTGQVAVTRNQQEFTDIQNYKQRVFGSTAYAPQVVQSSLQHTMPLKDDKEG